uniref:hypothetical protein n=1 Tax=uncultured Phenylobacterium sp. TaxID=349273 RepID=UPI0025F6CE8C
MSRAKAKAVPTDELREPTSSEAAAILSAVQSRGRRPTRVTIGLKSGADKVMAISNPHTDSKGWGAHLTDTLGTSSYAFCDQALLRLLNVIADANAVPTETQANAALAMMGAVAPANELEAAMGEQIIAAHLASLDFLRRARLNAGEYRDSAVAYGNLATKLSRTMAVQTEALAKLRNGGKQTVEVVYVDARGGRNN